MYQVRDIDTCTAVRPAGVEVCCSTLFDFCVVFLGEQVNFLIFEENS